MLDPLPSTSLTTEQSLFEDTYNQNQLETVIEGGKENVTPETQNATSVKKQINTKKRTFRTKRLENSITATNRLSDQSERKIKIKERYYQEKLNLLRENLSVVKEQVKHQKRVADALESLSKSGLL